MAAMTTDQGNSGAEACPIPRFRRCGARSWAVPAVAALHWAAVASLALPFAAACVAVWLGPL